MKYKERDELVAGLREFADFIEAKGIKLPISYPHVKMTVFVYGEHTPDGNLVPGSAATKMGKYAKVIAPCEKVWSDTYLDLRKDFGGGVQLEITSSRKNVCVPRVVGQREIEEQIIPARVEDIIEWDCTESLLGA